MNHDLVGLTPLQCLDKIVAYCGQVVRRIILDHHSSERNRFMQEPLWYVYYMMEERFIAVWVMLPIVAADLWNELKKNSTWSSGDLTTDWRLAAERVSNAIQQAVNPDWLLMVDVESTTWCLWPGSSPYAAVPGQDHGLLRTHLSAAIIQQSQQLLQRAVVVPPRKPLLQVISGQALTAAMVRADLWDQRHH